jgi:hypothetical protein
MLNEENLMFNAPQEIYIVFSLKKYIFILFD